MALYRSEGEWEKSRYLRDKVVPTPTEVVKKLGSPLARVFFGSLCEEERTMLGLTPELKGPGDDLWVSPSDLLIGKVKLRPPLTRKHKQALTHQAILELGEDVMSKHMNMLAEEKQRAIDEAVKAVKKEEKFKCEERVKIAIRNEKETCGGKTEKLEEENEERIAEYVHITMRKMMELMLAHMVRQKKELLELIEQKKEENKTKEEEIEEVETPQPISDEVEKEMKYAMRRADFLLKYQWKKMGENLYKAMKKIEETMINLKQDLENRKFREILYAKREEQAKFREQKERLDKEFEIKLQDFNKECEKEKCKVKSLEIKVKDALYENKYWNRKIKLITEEFQKFVTYVHDSVEGQSDYMLTVKKFIDDEFSTLLLSNCLTPLAEKRSIDIQVAPHLKDIGLMTDPIKKEERPSVDLHSADIAKEIVNTIIDKAFEKIAITVVTEEVKDKDEVVHEDKLVEEKSDDEILRLEEFLKEMKGELVDVKKEESSSEEEILPIIPETLYELFINLQKDQPSVQLLKNQKFQQLLSDMTLEDDVPTKQHGTEVITTLYEGKYKSLEDAALTKKKRLYSRLTCEPEEHRESKRILNTTAEYFDSDTDIIESKEIKYDVTPDSEKLSKKTERDEIRVSSEERIKKIIEILRDRPSLAQLFVLPPSL